MIPIPEKEKMKKIPIAELNGSKKLKTAIFLDVDGALAGKYVNGRRELRSTALLAIKMLSEYAPVFLWSVVEGNAERLVAEFSELSPYISGCYGKEDFPLDLVENPYCIDDEAVDFQVLKCNHVIVDTCRERFRACSRRSRNHH